MTVMHYHAGERGELKHLDYPQEKKTKCDSPSSGERTGKSPNRCRFGDSGVMGPRDSTEDEVQLPGKVSRGG